MSAVPNPAKVFGLVGWSGSGKTTLMVKLVPELTGRGFSISTMKHTHHRFDIDTPGKDSYEHRHAGATEVAVMSSSRWALMNELRGADEPTVEEMLVRMTPVDLVLIEGFKHHNHPKIEVFRPSVGQEMLAPSEPSVVAVASDEVIADTDLAVLDLNDIAAVADYILEHVGLGLGRQTKDEVYGAAE